jgi:hypothetical protein
MELTREEEAEAFSFQMRAWQEFKHPPPKTFRDLAWCVAVLAVRDTKPKNRGAKRKWSLELRLVLVTQIDDELQKRGWDRRGRSHGPKAAVPTVIAEMQQRHPFWRQFTADRLYKAYYEHYEEMKCLQGLLEEWTGQKFPSP